jgi:hypothetical protein
VSKIDTTPQLRFNPESPSTKAHAKLLMHNAIAETRSQLFKPYLCAKKMPQNKSLGLYPDVFILGFTQKQQIQTNIVKLQFQCAVLWFPKG